jgi:hypothetical protein
MSSWIRTDKNGAKYMAIAFREAEEEKKPAAKPVAKAMPELDPF